MDTSVASARCRRCGGQLLLGAEPAPYAWLPGRPMLTVSCIWCGESAQFYPPARHHPAQLLWDGPDATVHQAAAITAYARGLPDDAPAPRGPRRRARVTR